LKGCDLYQRYRQYKIQGLKRDLGGATGTRVRLVCEYLRYVPRSRSTNYKRKFAISKDTKSAIRRKHRLWGRYMETRDMEKYKEYCKARNKVRKLMRNERKRKEIEGHSNVSKKV
jgi:hypothetical protein